MRSAPLVVGEGDLRAGESVRALGGADSEEGEGGAGERVEVRVGWLYLGELVGELDLGVDGRGGLLARRHGRRRVELCCVCSPPEWWLI